MAICNLNLLSIDYFGGLGINIYNSNNKRLEYESDQYMDVEHGFVFRLDVV